MRGEGEGEGAPGVVRDYEVAFARSVSAGFASGFWKGRVALYAILRALGLRDGDEVILPGFTCIVVPNAVRCAGGRPVYADIAEGTYNIDPASVEKAVSSRSRALIVQHTFGIPADLDPLLEIARRHRLAVIEDCAHALWSRYRGRGVGTMGLAAFFSSQWSKPYTTGLGGVAVTDDRELAERIERLRDRFKDAPAGSQLKLRAQLALYRALFSPRTSWAAMEILARLSRLRLFVGSSSPGEILGAVPEDLDWRMSRGQARAGLRELRKLSENRSQRARLAGVYGEFLEARGWGRAPIPEGAEAVLLRYPLRVGNKRALLREAARARVELGSWFESALHPVQEPPEEFGYDPARCPVAERTAAEVINLPLHLRISPEEAGRILEFVDRLAERPGARSPAVVAR